MLILFPDLTLPRPLLLLPPPHSHPTLQTHQIVLFLPLLEGKKEVPLGKLLYFRSGVSPSLITALDMSWCHLCQVAGLGCLH